MRQNIVAPDCRIIGVDNSNSMLERCQSFIDTDTDDTHNTRNTDNTKIGSWNNSNRLSLIQLRTHG